MPNNTRTDATPTARLTKSEANQINGGKGTGPKTLRGKSHSRLNAVKHSLYSKELVISEADQPEFDHMCTGIRAELKPSTPLRENACDYVFVCSWRVKLAVRLEQRQFACRLQDEQHENQQNEAIDEDSVIKRRYGSSFLDIRAGIRLLEWAIAEFADLGRFREETRTNLKRGFGEDYLRLLEEWIPPISMTTMKMGEHLARHCETFGHADKILEKLNEPGETKIMMDPKQSQQMVCKLLVQQRTFLQDHRKIAEWNALGRADPMHSSDFNPRFLADANRELRRALEWYRHLEEQGL